MILLKKIQKEKERKKLVKYVKINLMKMILKNILFKNMKMNIINQNMQKKLNGKMQLMLMKIQKMKI